MRQAWPGQGWHSNGFSSLRCLTLMREMPVSKAGEILGETDQRLWRILFAHVKAAWTELSWEIYNTINRVGNKRLVVKERSVEVVDAGKK